MTFVRVMTLMPVMIAVAVPMLTVVMATTASLRRAVAVLSGFRIIPARRRRTLPRPLPQERRRVVENARDILAMPVEASPRSAADQHAGRWMRHAGPQPFDRRRERRRRRSADDQHVGVGGMIGTRPGSATQGVLGRKPLPGAAHRLEKQDTRPGEHPGAEPTGQVQRSAPSRHA